MAQKPSEQPDVPVTKPVDPIRAQVTWNPWLGMIFAVVVFFLAQIGSTFIVSIYPLIKGWNETQANDWLGSSVFGQFIFMIIADALMIGAIVAYLKINGSSIKAIGLRKPKWSDLGYGLGSVPIYFVIYFVSIIAVSFLFPSFNASQGQDVGFNNVTGTLPLLLTFISLAVLPPITEEIMMRGFFYGSAKKAMPAILAALFTSFIFAIAHLPEGSDGAPLYVAAVDTFVLSLVLIYLREKTGGLWASITLHMVKNTVAFLALYIFVTN